MSIYFNRTGLIPAHGPPSENMKHSIVIGAEVGLKLRGVGRNILNEPGFSPLGSGVSHVNIRRGRNLNHPSN